MIIRIMKILLFYRPEEDQSKGPRELGMSKLAMLTSVAILSFSFINFVPGKGLAVRLAPGISAGGETKTTRPASVRDPEEDRMSFARARMSTWKPGDAVTLKSQFSRGHERIDTTESRQVLRAGYDEVAIRITISTESIVPVQEIRDRREGGWIKTVTRSEEERIYDFPGKKIRKRVVQWCDGRRMPPAESTAPLGDAVATELFPYLFLRPEATELITAAAWTFECGVYDLDGGRRVWIDPMLPLGGVVLERSGKGEFASETRLVSVSARDPRVLKHLEKRRGKKRGPRIDEAKTDESGPIGQQREAAAGGDAGGALSGDKVEGH